MLSGISARNTVTSAPCIPERIKTANVLRSKFHRSGTKPVSEEPRPSECPLDFVKPPRVVTLPSISVAVRGVTASFVGRCDNPHKMSREAFV